MDAKCLCHCCLGVSHQWVIKGMEKKDFCGEAEGLVK